MMYFVLGALVVYSTIITLLFIGACNLAVIRKRRVAVLKKTAELAEKNNKDLLLYGVEDNRECRTDWPAVK